jgi:hypothetical protein
MQLLSFVLWRKNDGTGTLRINALKTVNNNGDEAMIILHFASVLPLGKTSITFMYTIILFHVRAVFQ